ncbi:MAG: hypothetical protein ACJAS4_001264 [Bacteriovoracaceae bacterium]|jgi:hypothetical protein
MKKFTLTVLFLSLFSGVNHAAQTIKVDAFNIEDSRFVPVFVGGWGSCDSLRSVKEKRQFGFTTPHGMFLYNQAVRYVQTINKHAEVGIKKFVLVCATKGSQNGLLAQGSIRTLTYEVKNQEILVPKYKAALVNLDSHQDNTYREVIRLLPILDRREHLTTRLLRVANGSPLVLFGHSYGGWIAKRIVEILAAPEVYKSSKHSRDRRLYNDTIKEFEKFESFPIRAIFSLEGISAVTCRITKSIKAGIQNSLGKETHPGCREELKSFHKESNLGENQFLLSLPLSQTAAKVDAWYNIMLDNSDLPTRAGLSTTPGIENTLLHINPYGTKDQYKKSQAHPFKNAHHMLGFETKTWKKICELTFQGDESICNPISKINNKGR